MEAALARLGDARGQVILGWLRPSVFYLRLTGDLVGVLGDSGTQHFSSLLHGSTSVVCFVDAYDVDQMDFTAKSALVRALMSNRHRLSSTYFLAQDSAVEGLGLMVAGMFGSGFVMTRNVERFQSLIDEAAPRSDWRRRSGLPAKPLSTE